jgi:hypothetical protein
MICYWDEWNREHATRHGVPEADIEHVLHYASPPYPEYLGAGKYRVRGQTRSGTHIQVIFVHKSAEDVDFEKMSIEELIRLESAKGPYAYPIHARELIGREKRREGRRRKGYNRPRRT